MLIATARLRDLVLLGELAPGEQVRQEQIAELLGVGRAPLREALNVLAKHGPLVHKPNQGYFVAKRLPIEHAQIRRMLELLENELMGSLDWPDEKTLARLEQLHEAMCGYVEAEPWAPMLKLNRQFHFEIFGLSPFKLILQQVDQLWAVAEPYQAAKLSSVEARLRTVDEHRRLIEALRAQDRMAGVGVLDAHRLA
ncbi:GntR family transcriptional regulator [Variovorax sp. LT1R16]|uniref:GntR family transcriptional regulator n=1 Tax=Variovorax sp. LT1R16 TaxID=3443728 RepID=UPI003F466FFE